jgi:hypothetical protein
MPHQHHGRTGLNGGRGEIVAVGARPGQSQKYPARCDGSRIELDVESEPAFAEGAALDRALSALLELDEVNGVACSHGDLIPPLLRELRELGMVTDGPLLDQKGSLWIIETVGGRPTFGTYRAPKF